MITVRNATLNDAKSVLEIYEYYVKNTVITFEYTVPDLEEFRGRMKKTMQKYPYIVAELDGEVCGYAYAGAFVGRAAYDWSCELTVYVKPDMKKCGIGRTLYDSLTERLAEIGITNLYACIGCTELPDEYLNNNSAEFHSHMGFSLAGTFHKCGYQFGRWYDMIWMEKIIGSHTDCQPPIRPYKYK